MVGYGGTDAPDSASYYTFKRAADDIALLAQSLGLSSIILGGHDWGGAIVYRVAIWYPKLVSALFSICTPLSPPQTKHVPLSQFPNFKYQNQFSGPDLEREVVGEAKIREFLNGMYGGRGSNGETAFDVSHGYYVENGAKLQPTRLLSKEELDFYAKRYAIHGLHGPLNWYRTGKLNFKDEEGIAAVVGKQGMKLDMPILFIAGKKDSALPPEMSLGMEKWCRSLTRGEVNAGHWALWEQPQEVNRYITEWLVGHISTKANL